MAVLSAPLDWSDEETWVAALNRSIAKLLDAAGGGTILTRPGPRLTARFHGLDDAVVRIYRELVDSTDDGRPHFRYPDLERVIRRMIAAGVEVWTPPMAARLTGIATEDMAYTQEVIIPTGTGHHVTVSLPLGRGTAIMAFYHETPDQDPLREDRVPLLRLLLPAFRSGVEGVSTLRRNARAFVDQQAEDPRAWLVFHPDGRLLHLNPAARALFSEDPSGDAETAARRLANRLGELRRPQRKSAPGVGALTETTELAVGGTDYELTASFLPAGLLDADWTVAVCATARTPSLPSAETIVARTALTRRQAEVARLIASGLSGPDIAEELGLSVHTVRRHTEAILTRLRIRSRAAVAIRILGVRVRA